MRIPQDLTSKQNNKDYKLTFADYWFQQSLSYIRPTLVITIALLFMFYPVDGIILNSHAAEYLQQARTVFMAPAISFFFLLSYTRISPNQYFFGLSLVYLIGGTLFSHAMSLDGSIASLYGFIGVAHVLVLLMIPSRIPASFSIPFGIVLLSINISTVYALDSGVESTKLMYSLTLVTFAAILCLSVVVRDLNAYRNYHSLKNANQLTQDQALWASMIARVLKHELGNLLTGITSSVEMMQLVDSKSEDSSILTNAVSRNLATVSKFRQLLTRISEYANVDLDQAANRLYSFKLSDALNPAISNFERRHPDADVILSGTNKVIDMRGDTLLLTLALESLIEYSYTTFIHAENEKISIGLTLKGHSLELHLQRENGDESAILKSPLSQPQADELTTLQTPGMNGEQFALQIAKHILGLHSAAIISDENTATSMLYRINFARLQPNA